MEQLTLFELFTEENYQSIDLSQPFQTKDFSLYLNKGDRKVTSLKREIKSLTDLKKEKGITPGVFDIKYKAVENADIAKDLDYYFRRISKIIWPMLKKCESVEDFYALSEKLFNGYFNINVEIVSPQSDISTLVRLLLKDKKVTSPSIIKVNVTNEPELNLNFVSCLSSELKKKYHNTTRYYTNNSYKSNVYFVNDLGLFLSQLYLIYVIKEYVIKNDIKATYQLLSEFYLHQNDDETKTYLSSLDLDLSLDDLPSNFIITSDSVDLSDHIKMVRGIDITIIRSKKSPFVVRNKNHKHSYIDDRAFLLSIFEISHFNLFTLREMYKGGSQDSNDYSNRFSINQPVILAFLFKMLLYENNMVIAKHQYLSNIESTYAASYETKKNIPQKTKDAMNHSLFNKFFGYVEFDELVDLNKVAEVEREFMAFSTLFKEVSLYDNYSIRFRRLGKYKAAGLYFPGVNALCVDINSPNALIHEYAHMLDYINANLSEQIRFLPIYSRYKSALEEIVNSMDKDHIFKKKWEGRSKYNKSYYLNETEVFARCFEMYFRCVLNINNSLCGDCQGYVYPIQDTFLMGLIKDYFNSTFTFQSKDLKNVV